MQTLQLDIDQSLFSVLDYSQRKTHGEKFCFYLSVKVVVKKKKFKSHFTGGHLAAPLHGKDGVPGICYKEAQFPVLREYCEERAALLTSGFFTITSVRLSK